MWLNKLINVSLRRGMTISVALPMLFASVVSGMILTSEIRGVPELKPVARDKGDRRRDECLFGKRRDRI